jgi:hypothetical protein
MIKVFTAENRMIVYNMKNLLHSEGIDTVMKNEFSGGGVGDLPAFDIWPEIWIRDETQLARAQSILQGVTEVTDAEAWVCRGCQESNDAVCGICWNCGRSYE